MNTDQFPEFDWNFEDDSYERSMESAQFLPCQASMIVHEEAIVTLPNFTEGILLGGHILVMIFSGCGNIAALIIVVKSKAPKLSTKYFLIMLALSDLLMTLVAPPTEIAKMLSDYSEWIFGELLCKVVPFLQLVSATMSALCLVAIAAERNFLIVRAMSSSASLVHVWHKWVLPVIAVVIIIFPIGSALPQLWFYGLRDFLAIPAEPSSPSSSSPSSSSIVTKTSVRTSIIQASTTTTTTARTSSPLCDIRHFCWRNDFDSRNITYWGVTGATYFILLLCFLVSYISIYNFVKKHGQVRKQLEEDYYAITVTTSSSVQNSNESNAGKLPRNGNNPVAGERHRKTLKLILGLILLHLCCRAPNWVYLVIVNVRTVRTTKVTKTLLECFHLLSTINCALNPFLYVIWNHSLRKNREERSGKSRFSQLCNRAGILFYSVFCCCCKRKRGGMDSHVSGDPVMQQPTSSMWLWKTPTVYHVSSNNENKNTTTANQRTLYSENRAM